MKKTSLAFLSLLCFFLGVANSISNSDFTDIPTTDATFPNPPSSRGCGTFNKYPVDFDDSEKPPGMFYKDTPQELTGIIEELFPEGSSPFDAFTAGNVFVRCLNEAGCWMDVTWLLEGAGYKNVFGWYYFNETSRTIDADGLQSLFPDVSRLGSGGCLLTGDTVRIFFEYDRPVGFWAKANGYDGSPDGKTDADTWYSVVDYEAEGGLTNDDGYDEELEDQADSGEGRIPTRHFGWVRLANYVDNKDLVVFGLEDLPDLGDRDYNDAMFALQIGPEWNEGDVIRYDPDTGTIEQCVQFDPQQHAEYIFDPTCIPHIPLDPRVGEEAKECGAFYVIPDGWEIAPAE